MFINLRLEILYTFTSSVIALSGQFKHATKKEPILMNLGFMCNQDLGLATTKAIFDRDFDWFVFRLRKQTKAKGQRSKASRMLEFALINSVSL